jgi:hypothetical protein
MRTSAAGRARVCSARSRWGSGSWLLGSAGVGGGGRDEVAGQVGGARGGTRDERSGRSASGQVRARLQRRYLPQGAARPASGVRAWPGPTVSRRPDLPNSGRVMAGLGGAHDHGRIGQIAPRTGHDHGNVRAAMILGHRARRGDTRFCRRAVMGSGGRNLGDVPAEAACAQFHKMSPRKPS